MTEILSYDEDTAFSIADDAATVSALVRRTDPARLASTRFGEWTALEVVAHITEAAEVFADRIRRCAEEDEPTIESWDQDAAMAALASRTPDPVDLSRRLLRAHQSIVRTLQQPGMKERAGVHAEWGHVPAAHFGAYHAKHCHEHVAELAAAFPPA